MNPRQIADKRRLFTVCSGTTAKTAWFPPFIVTDPPRHAVQILSYSKPRWLHTISIDNLFYCRNIFSGVWSGEKEKTIKVAFGASSIEEKNTKIVSVKLLLRLCFGLLMSSPHVGRASGIRGQHRFMILLRSKAIQIVEAVHRFHWERARPRQSKKLQQAFLNIPSIQASP